MPRNTMNTILLFLFFLLVLSHVSFASSLSDERVFTKSTLAPKIDLSQVSVDFESLGR